MSAAGAIAARLHAVFAAAILAFALAGGALAAPTFPALTGRVVDDAHLLTPETAQRLSDELAGLERQTGHQLVVVTVPDLQGYEIEDYGYQLGRTWQIGRKGINDGAILLVAPKERKVRIEVGYGLEPVLTDALSNVILQRKVLPQFKQGRMEQGIVDGTEALIQQLSLPDDQAKQNVVQAAQQPQAAPSGGGVPFAAIFGMLIVFWIISSLFRRRSFAGGGGGLWWLLPLILSSGGRGRSGGGWSGGGFGGGGFGGGGFSGGGGSFGGGGSSGSW